MPPSPWSLCLAGSLLAQMSLALGRQQRTLPTALLSAYRSPSVLQTATVSLSVGPNERRQQSTRTAASRQQSQPSVSRQVGKSRTYSNSMPLKQQSDVDVAAATPSTTTVASPYVLTTALTAFSLITWDVFQGPHWLVSHLDEPAQHWVFTSLSFETRQLAGSWVLSNSFIATGVLGWWAAGVTLIAQSGRKGLYLLSTAIAAYLLGGGFLLSGDVLLVDFIKHIFQRARPSTLHKTFSFPSGHTTAGQRVPCMPARDAFWLAACPLSLTAQLLCKAVNTSAMDVELTV